MWLRGWGHSSIVTWPFQWRSDQNKQCWCGRSDITQQLNCTWQQCIRVFVLFTLAQRKWRENNRCMQSLKIFFVKGTLKWGNETRCPLYHINKNIKALRDIREIKKYNKNKSLHIIFNAFVMLDSMHDALILDARITQCMHICLLLSTCTICTSVACTSSLETSVFPCKADFDQSCTEASTAHTHWQKHCPSPSHTHECMLIRPVCAIRKHLLTNRWGSMALSC